MLFSDMLKQLKQWDKEYAQGAPSVSDIKYDKLRERAFKLKPNHSYFKLISTRDSFGDKVKLPTEMMSLSKIRPSGLKEWATHDTEYLLSPKLDGLSGKIQYKKGKLYKIFTRGDGITGRDVTNTAKYINGVLPKLPAKIDAEFNGEFIIHRSLFQAIKNNEYKACRNFVVGMLNTKEPKVDLLSKMTFIVYSVDCNEKKFPHKLNQIAFAANCGFVTITNLGRCDEKTYKAHQQEELLKYPINYIGLAKIGKYHFQKIELTEKLISFYLKTWREVVDIDQDGLVLEVADTKLRKKLGSNDTPNYAVAIKPEIHDHVSILSKVETIEWNQSSRGLFKPTIVLVKPANFSGVEVTRITAHNAKIVKDFGIDKGSIVKIIRSGDVIPRLIGVKTKGKASLPKVCPHCDNQLQWTTSKTDLWCDNTSCVGFQTERVVDFFQKFKVDKLAVGTVQKLIKAGYNTVPKIMKISEQKLETIDGLGEKSAKTIITNLKQKLKKVSLAEVMDASTMFSTESAGLGKQRAKLIIKKISEKGVLDKPIDSNLYKVISLEIDGIGETLATQFVDNLAAFRLFYRELPIGSIEKLGSNQGTFAGKIAVWSGYRSKEEEDMWVKKGGEVGNSVTKKTSVLFTSTPESSKSKKAVDYGVKIVGKDSSIRYINST